MRFIVKVMAGAGVFALAVAAVRIGIGFTA
jgi:hypothetical protein